MKYSLWVISKGMLFRKDPINQNYRVTKKKKRKQKEDVFIFKGSMTKNINAFYIERFSPG